MAPLVLGTGFHWNHPMIQKTNFPAERVRLGIEKGHEEISAAGYDMEDCLIESTDLDVILKNWI